MQDINIGGSWGKDPHTPVHFFAISCEFIIYKIKFKKYPYLARTPTADQSDY